MTGSRIGVAALGLIALALSAYIAWGTWSAPPIAARTVVGPGVFPLLIAAGLLAVGLRLFWEAWRGEEAEPIPAIDWVAVAVVGGALLAFALLLERLGWVVAATLLFVAVAAGFGSRRQALDAAIGLALAALTFFVFDTLLGLSLPLGAWTEAALARAGLLG